MEAKVKGEYPFSECVSVLWLEPAFFIIIQAWPTQNPGCFVPEITAK